LASDQRYFWNYALYNDFITQSVDPHWFTPLIQGYVGQIEGEIGSMNLQFVLISRRMHNRAGTRYNARGIDDLGFVGNQCETEQIMVVDNKHFMSHVQIRGSVPVFWEQKGIYEDTQLTRNPQMSKKAFRLHFGDIINTYGPVHCINLLRDKTKKEIRITREYIR
jgi:hypothetical protein